jgi:hypothetical protein
MIEATDFRFRDDLASKQDTVPIEILIAPYKGVILRYNQVNVKEMDNGTATLRFAYDLIETADHTQVSLRKDQRFEQHLGILLNHLILESLEAAEANVNADRENYSEESDAERSVHSQGPAVS